MRTVEDYAQAEADSPGTDLLQKITTAFPSDVFIAAAGLSVLLSLSLKASGRRHDALFVGQWAPTFLSLGLYGRLTQTLMRR